MAFQVITRKIYNDQIELIFNPNSRNRYLVNLPDGSSLNPPGVTTVLGKVLAKEALMLWPLNMATNWLKDNCLDNILTELHLEEARRQHTIRSDYGKNTGSEVHSAIEIFLGGGKVDVSEDAAAAYRAFIDWHRRTKPKVIGTEEIVYSRELNVAGTFDALLEIDGKRVLADVKTTNISRDAPMGIYPENFLQLGAYAYAYREMTGDAIDELMVINASKQGKLSTLTANDLDLGVRDCEDAFLSVIAVYKFLEPLKKLIKARSR